MGRPRRLTRAEAKANTRERLLEAAAQVFAQKGFAGASVEEIVESAGFSTGALYSNFDGKEQLFLELLSDRRSKGITRRVTAVSEILDKAASDNKEPFDALGQMFLKVADRNSELAPLQAEFWLYAVRNPGAMGVIAAKLGEQIDSLEPLVEMAMKRSEIAPDISAHSVTTVILALFQGLVHQRRVDPANVSDELFAQALRWLFAGMHVVPAGMSQDDAS